MPVLTRQVVRLLPAAFLSIASACTAPSYPRSPATRPLAPRTIDPGPKVVAPAPRTLPAAPATSPAAVPTPAAPDLGRVLRDAAKSGDLVRIDSVLSHGANVNSANPAGETAL